MQWLIDMVIAAIGVPPCYIPTDDFPGIWEPPGGWVKDGTWNTADVSAVVPALATSINVDWKFQSDGVGGAIYLRPVGHVGFVHTCMARTLVADIWHNINTTISLDKNKQFQYRFLAGHVWEADFRIRGWWL